MDEAVQPFAEINEWAWTHLKNDLKDLTPEEIDWRPLPQANTINLIVRHLRIEAEWHLASLEHGEEMPSEVTPALQQQIDSVPADFQRNLTELDDLYTRFIAALRRTTADDLQRQTALAYRLPPGEGGSVPARFLGFHQMVHLATHWGQIRSIRNLYRTTRGEPARFFPENPSYPKR